MKKNIKTLLILTASCGCLTACSEAITNAGYNTLLGMGMAFFVLILISLVISLFPLLRKMQSKAHEASNEEERRLQSIDNTISHIERQEQSEIAKKHTNTDAELIAVIGAAIAAYEADLAQTGDVVDYASHGGYYVRSIRKIGGNWKRA